MLNKNGPAGPMEMCFSTVLYKAFFIVIVLLFSSLVPVSAQSVLQSPRDIPIVKNVDVIVIGGSTYAAAAAGSAASEGANVFLVAPMLYLGEDLCGTMRLSRSENVSAKTPLEKAIFGSGNITTPGYIKKVLDEYLLNAGVDFTLGSFVSDVIFDSDQKPGGVVIANRAGRQAVIGKVIIDATDRAVVCRLAGAKSYPWDGRELDFQRTIVLPGDSSGQIEYVTRHLSVPMPDLTFASFARAEQTAREITWAPGQLRASEILFCIPPDPLVCKKTSDDYSLGRPAGPGHFTPAGFDTLYVLSGCADLPRSIAEELLAPGGLCETAERIGRDAARKAQARPIPAGLHLKIRKDARTEQGDVKELLTGLRPTDKGLLRVHSPATSINIVAEYDVVVVGGGTSGAPAAIAAARQGRSVLVVEYQYGLGGIGTLGLIGKPCGGKLIGFSKEVPFPDETHNMEYKMHWYRREVLKAGGHIWFGVIGCGAIADSGTLKGVVVATPHGRIAVSAKVVIDATGNCDIAVAAGAPYMYGAIENNCIAMQGAGYPPRPLNSDYVNSDYLLIDESDMVNLTASVVGARQGMSADRFRKVDALYDIASMVQTRERRRIVGDHILRYVDQIAERTYPDSIVHSQSGYDSHGYPVSPVFALLPHNEKSRGETHPAPGGSCYTPYRCLLPRGLDNILVTGLGISMERDASAAVRMQFDMANQGYAAGLAASMAIEEDIPPRNINIRSLQKKLIEIGNLTEEVLTHQDSFPLPGEVIQQAVEDYGRATYSKDAGKPLCILYTHKDIALPFALEYYRRSEGRGKLQYARLLGVWGVAEVLPTLIEELNSIDRWDERILQGVMAEYAHLPTPIDASILAAGFTGERSAVPAILRLLETLDASVTLSHHRAAALALEHLADPAAARPLADLLNKPKISGHVMKSVEPLYNSPVELRRREGALREIVLARALYRCGDHEGLARKILNEYRTDVRALFARHAEKILSDPPGPTSGKINP